MMIVRTLKSPAAMEGGKGDCLDCGAIPPEVFREHNPNTPEGFSPDMARIENLRRGGP
jgi:hypothetical protein